MDFILSTDKGVVINTINRIINLSGIKFLTTIGISVLHYIIPKASDTMMSIRRDRI